MQCQCFTSDQQPVGSHSTGTPVTSIVSKQRAYEPLTLSSRVQNSAKSPAAPTIGQLHPDFYHFSPLQRWPGYQLQRWPGSSTPLANVPSLKSNEMGVIQHPSKASAAIVREPHAPPNAESDVELNDMNALGHPLPIGARKIARMPPGSSVAPTEANTTVEDEEVLSESSVALDIGSNSGRLKRWVPN